MFQLFRSLDEAAGRFGPCALAIGNFDGVHRGHRRILETTVARACAEGLAAGVLTFDPHPVRVLAPERAPAVMTTLEQRLERFRELGVERALALPFTLELAAYSPDRFARDILAGALAAKWVIVGAGFRFGSRQAGDVATLEQVGRELGFAVDAVAALEWGGIPVSSSRVRAAVAEGRMAEARRLLGAPFPLRGTVVSGRGIGSRRTVPTLNLVAESELLPADGVYVSETADLATGQVWPSVTNVGLRPTFGPGGRVVETHLLGDFGGAAPERIEVRFFRRLRDERSFASPEELKARIVADIALAERCHRLRAAAGRACPALAV
jgi:riboflavin kinase / FMN adenylyltransferase